MVKTHSPRAHCFSVSRFQGRLEAGKGRCQLARDLQSRICLVVIDINHARFLIVARCVAAAPDPRKGGVHPLHM